MVKSPKVADVLWFIEHRHHHTPHAAIVTRVHRSGRVELDVFSYSYPGAVQHFEHVLFVADGQVPSERRWCQFPTDGVVMTPGNITVSVS